MTGEDILSVSLTGIITVAIVAVIVRKGGPSTNLITGFTGVLAGVIKAAVGQGQSFAQPQLDPARGIGTPSVGLVGPGLPNQP